MPPITKTNDELIKEAIEEASKKTADSIYEKLKSEGSESTGSKITQILNKAKGQTTSTSENQLEEIKKKEREEFDKKREELEKKLEESEVYCPTCSGHKHEHKLKKTEKGTMKCTGDNCGTEFSLIPNSADYACEDCGTPHLRPVNIDGSIGDTCPFCGSNKFTNYGIDYTKIREKVDKRNKKKKK